jgi:AraC-like DNA-binding protein
MLLLSVFSLIFSVLLLAYNKGYKSANIYLAMFLFLFNLIILTNYLYFYSNSKTILAFLLCIPINPTSYLLGPLVFFYVRAILKNNIHFAKYDWLHFIAFAVIFIGRFPYIFISWEAKLKIADGIINHYWINLTHSKVNNFLPIILNFKLRGLHFLLYLIAIWYLILRPKFKESSDKESPNQIKGVNQWLYFFTGVISFLGVSLFIIVLNFLNAKDRITFQNDWNFMISLVYIGIFLLVFGLILFPQILYGIPVIRTSLFNKVNESSSSVKDKVENISFDLDYIEKINFLLSNWIKEKKYLDLESSTFSLSKDIDLPHHHVTYFFNNVNDEKYIEWRSRLRVGYAMSLINSEKGYVKTIERLGKESGFKSYATFIKSFKLVTGKLPNDYIKDLKA